MMAPAGMPGMIDVEVFGGADRVGRDMVHAPKTATPTTAVAAIARSHDRARRVTRLRPRQAVPSFRAANTIKPIAHAKPPTQTRLRIAAIEAR